jgi:hypothetical protein
LAVPRFVALEKLKFELLNPHIARASEIIKDFTAIFIFEDGQVGSGTFVNVGGFTGILTAYHVAQHLYKFKKFKFCVAEYPHDFGADSSLLQHVPIGPVPPDSSPEDGPDLSFLIIRDTTLAEAVQAEKLFYNLDFARPYSVHEPLMPKLWGVAGTLADSLRRIAEDYKGEPLSLMTNLVGAGTFSHEIRTSEGFDYLRLTVPSGSYNFPYDYAGMSGGGFWLMPFEIGENKDTQTIRCRPPYLAGVEFSQLKRDPANREKVLIGHGPDSILLLRETLKSKTSSLYPLTRPSNLPN